jgi:hypothetical protein
MPKSLDANEFIPTEVAEETLKNLYPQVEGFIQRLFDKDWEIEPYARTMQIKHPITKERGTLSELLGRAIVDYQDKQREVSESILRARNEAEQVKWESGDKPVNLSPELEKPAKALVALVALQQVLPKGIELEKSARNCQALISIAFAHGVVRQGDGLSRRLGECNEKNAKLEKELHILSGQYQQAQKDLAGLQKIMDKSNPLKKKS